MTEHGGRETARCFFALWPGTATRRALAQMAARLPEVGRAVPMANYHLTLAFMGDVARQAEPELIAAASRVGVGADAVSGRLRLDRLDGFEHAGVLFAAPSYCPPWLSTLRARLVDRLADAGYSPEDAARPFRPHVTLRRRLSGGLPALSSEGLAAVSWQVGGFVLLESPLTSGQPGYRVVYRWEAS